MAHRNRRRRGKVLVMLAILMPAIFAVVALVFDAGGWMEQRASMQHVADAAATAAARDLLLGRSSQEATASAVKMVQVDNALVDADVDVFIPPTQGQFAGSADYVEVVIRQSARSWFLPSSGADLPPEIEVRAVAGHEAVTAGAAVMALDPDPANLSLAGLPLVLPPLPALLAGVETLGVGAVTVDGAVLVNNEWGGLDEHGDQVGTPAGLKHAIVCTPLVPVNAMKARNIRVVGGVDDPSRYGPLVSQEEHPLQANRMPVPDPFADLPAPSTAVDPANVSTTWRGTASVLSLPLLSPPVRLQPGVYDWIEVTAGSVIFEPGVYIIRGAHPLTGVGLNLLGGTILGDGVMFYLTDSSSYSAASGAPDANDDPDSPPENSPQFPSAVINLALPDSRLSGLNSPGSPFDGMLLYQRRLDRRAIVVVHQDLLGSSGLSGTIYARWGHVLLAGKGEYNARLVGGTVRIVGLLDVMIRPDELLPPARDVFLVE